MEMPSAVGPLASALCHADRRFPPGAWAPLLPLRPANNEAQRHAGLPSGQDGRSPSRLGHPWLHPVRRSTLSRDGPHCGRARPRIVAGGPSGRERRAMTEPSGPGRTLTPKPGTRRSAKRRGWWSTLPGILTASAGRSEPPARPGAAPARQTERTLAVPAESEVVLEDGRLVVALKGMRLRPYSADRQRLTPFLKGVRSPRSRRAPA